MKENAETMGLVTLLATIEVSEVFSESAFWSDGE